MTINRSDQEKLRELGKLYRLTYLLDQEIGFNSPVRDKIWESKEDSNRIRVNSALECIDLTAGLCNIMDSIEKARSSEDAKRIMINLVEEYFK